MRMRYDAIANRLPISWSNAQERLEREALALPEAVTMMNGVRRSDALARQHLHLCGPAADGAKQVVGGGH